MHSVPVEKLFENVTLDPSVSPHFYYNSSNAERCSGSSPHPTIPKHPKNFTNYEANDGCTSTGNPVCSRAGDSLHPLCAKVVRLQALQQHPVPQWGTSGPWSCALLPLQTSLWLCWGNAHYTFSISVAMFTSECAPPCAPGGILPAPTRTMPIATGTSLPQCCPGSLNHNWGLYIQGSLQVSFQSSPWDV